MNSVLQHPLLRHPWVRGPLVVGLGLGLVLGGWMALIMADKALFYHQSGRQPYSSLGRMAAKEIVTRLVKPIYDRQLLATTDLPIYDLELTPRRFDEWHAMLDRVNFRGRSVEEDRVYIPAVFHYGRETWQVDIRGRGTLTGHYKKDKPSIRVRFPRDRYFEGRRVMNLIVPYEQARVMVDTTLNAIARHYDLVVYPRKFAVVRMNGEVLGVYQEMDHFRKELPVLQSRSEGFLTSALGEGKGGSEKSPHPGFREAMAALVACIEECPPEQAEHLLDRYFDFEKTAVYSALTTWFSSHHAWGPDNLILFFDPAYGRFEPIPWDVGIDPIYLKAGAQETPEKVFESSIDLGDHLLRRPAFRMRRNEFLWDMVHRKRQFALDESARQWNDIWPELAVDTEYSRKRTQGYYTGFQRIVHRNAEILKDLLARHDLTLRVGNDAVEFVNRAAAEVDVKALVFEDTDGNLYERRIEATVPSRFREEPGRWSAPLDVPEGIVDVRVEAHHHLTQDLLPPEDITWESADLPVITSPSNGEETRPLPAGLVAEKDLWTFSGEVRVTENLAQPDGVRTVFEPGLRLSLDADVVLVLRGDLESRGTTEQPIVVRATDPAQPFATFAVLGRPSRPAVVTLEHTTIDGGREGGFLGVHFSGSFSVYSGSLDMRHSRLLNAAGEDGLNVKYGSATIEHTLFENTASDAVDLDFCTGWLRHNVIRRTLGDGFDFSGSIIEVEDNRFEDCADKGMSVGEDTIILAHNNTVHNGTTGAAVKDLSLARLDELVLTELEVGVAIYQKKQVFDSATVSLGETSLEAVATPLLTDPEASVQHLPRN